MGTSGKKLLHTNSPHSLEEFLDFRLHIIDDVNARNNSTTWTSRFPYYLEKALQKESTENKEFSSFELVALIAYAMRTTGADYIFYRHLFEYLEDLIRTPFTCSVQRSNDGYLFTNHKMLGMVVHKPEAKIGQPIPSSVVRDSAFRQEVIDLFMKYLNCIRFSEKMDVFAMDLKDIVKKYQQ